jgi:2-octaprenyl-6-methoxyphenol hydroxylase
MPAEIAIVGAGPVGCALALLLQARGRTPRLAGRERHAALTAALRPIALSHASRLILERAGAWGRFPATPIETIHVSQAGGFGRTVMSAADAGVPALGYVVEYAALSAALEACLGSAGVAITPEGAVADAALTVHAEGSSQDATEKRYAQHAVVARVGVRPRAARAAYERFTAGGPLALLPLEGDYAVVWGAAPERARILAACAESDFLGHLSAAFGRRAGGFVSVADRSVFPLALRVRAARIGGRAAYVGNAAQTLHPVAGQGLNLGLRDAWDLARTVASEPDPGAPPVLARYAALRRLDAAAAIRVTDLLAGLFLGANPLAGAARGLALAALDACAPARRFVARRMIFGPSALP